MRVLAQRTARTASALAVILAAPLAAAQPRTVQPPQPTAAAPAPAAVTAAASAAPPAPAPPASPPAATGPVTHGDGMRAYHEALLARRLGWRELTVDDVRTRLAECEGMLRDGRTDEAVSRMTEVVEHPRFDLFAEGEDGRASIALLGDALAAAGAYEPARAYFRKLLAMPNAWEAYGTYARRAVRRLVEMAMETTLFEAILSDLKDVPSTAPEETRGEVAYVAGRAREAAGDPDGALAQYASITQKSRFWAQATYLQGLIHVEKGRFKEGENLFCKVADPGRQSATTPVFADERYFAVRDLARLALGRVAHEQGRFDDSRYYYYLVPRDSDRLAEALYEAATSRYEKKDYQGAAELLDELNAIQGHHRYEDEAWVLGAYIDLAQCKFPEADKKLREFIARYEPVRDAARRVAEDDRAVKTLLEAARTGGDAGRAEVGGASVSPDAMRAIAALLRIDPTYGAVARRAAILEHEASGLRLTTTSLDDMQKQLATNGGVRAGVDEHDDARTQAAASRTAIDGVRHQIDDLEAARAPAERIAPLRKELATLEDLLARSAAAPAPTPLSPPGTATDLSELLRNDATRAAQLWAGIDAARAELARSESLLAKDTLRRFDLRLSRLLRRARLGRIESVLGRKRALEVEIEAINDGVLPGSALDSIDAARYLKDSEEYWPFEGDDWRDEFVGSETVK
jgi:tetratricopeptide (TPR) repeat protein